MNKLNRGIAVGAVWLLTLKFFMRGTGIISTLILVRILSPEDFGLNAIAMSIFGFVDIFSRFGFDTVLIQKQDSTRGHYDTAWTFNVLFGITACAIVLATAPIVSNFYGNPDLKAVLMATSLLFLLNGFLNIGTVDFRKNLNFNKEFKLQIVPKAVSFVVTILTAFWLRNYWALVIGTLVWKAFICYYSYLMHPFRPRFSLVAWRDLFNFSKWIFLGNFTRFLNRKSPELLIGKIISTQATGVMSIGSEISTFATSELVANINRAAYPGYAKASSELETLRKTYLSVMAGISLWVVPAGVGLSSIATVLIPVALGNQWGEVAGLIEYLAVGNLIFALNSNTVYIFLALAKPEIPTYISLVRVFTFIPVLVYLMSINGIIGAAQAVCVASVVTFLFYTHLIINKLKFSVYDILKIHIRPLISSLIMGYGVYLLKIYSLSTLGYDNWIVLILCILLGLLLYVFFILIFWFLSGCPDGPEKTILNILRSRFHLLFHRPS